MPQNADISFNYEKKHIPQIIGAIDGTHIPILPPSDGYRDFINRKGWPSLVLQAVVDYSFRFRNINCQAPGASHDSVVFQRSQIYKDHDQLTPFATHVINGTNIPYMLMGDPAHPLLSWLIKGYTRMTRLTPEEESFNTYLNCGRISVEIAFGRLKARWHCLLKRLDIHFTLVPAVVAACCILHNIVESKKETFYNCWEAAVAEAELIFPQPVTTANRTRSNNNASNIRMC